MENIVIPFNYNNTNCKLELAFVEGTPKNDPFLFGNEQAISLQNFFIATTETTQALWEFIMGDDRNRSQYKNDQNPVEHVSWYDVQDFLTLLNKKFGDYGQFRLPTETEWEYAARGGQGWKDGFHFAGSNDMEESGWYEGNAGPYRDMATISRLKNKDKLTVAHAVAQKKPNQLGLYDMNGNLWEWCQDWFVRDAGLLPKDGSAYNIQTDNKVLRGGCHHNFAIHCTNTKRYEIDAQSFDGCIGFRVVFDAPGKD
jgi:sulfatase modifying factor 1